MSLKFQTFSVVAGSEACNARCNFCISGMTPTQGVEKKHVPIDTSRLRASCRLAEKCGVTTALITGKGEPTLFPEDIDVYLHEAYLPKYFPLIELQTNAINFTKDREKWEEKLVSWQLRGLTTVIISIVHYQSERNREIYCDQDGKRRFDYPPLEETIKMIHEAGLSVRLSCVGCKGYIDSPEELKKLIEFAQENKVEQLTWRPVTTPDEKNIRNEHIYEQTKILSIDLDALMRVACFVQSNGMRLMTLAHGAEVYDVWGQNLCLSNCLTHSNDSEDQRQLIYFGHNGRLCYSWEYTGAVIL